MLYKAQFYSVVLEMITSFVLFLDKWLSITLNISLKVKMLVAQSCLTLCNPMDCSPPGSSVHRILLVRILKWVAMPFLRGSSWPRDWTWVFHTASRFFTIWAGCHYRSPSYSFSLIYLPQGHRSPTMCGNGNLITRFPEHIKQKSIWL